MVVTDITNISGSKSRFRVYIDEEFAFVLYKGELRTHGLTVGANISTEGYCEIMTKILPKRAKMRSLHLLKNRSYTETQIRNKLTEGEYSEEIINDTINYLKSYRYIDDTQFAKNYIEYHKNNKSRNRILRDLSKKGISFDITAEIYSRITDGRDEETENNQILYLLEKRKFDKSTADLKERHRVYTFLLSKGFMPDSIKRFL
ncbi:MAG: regulatory protein RecX [Lachnospiraceae bacterium]|nr:regulatory protein RecX [Lachnospiraceae bacterium]